MNFFMIALMFIGTVIGAGFASGREAWQYFGVFGNKAYCGLAMEALLFLSFGVMTTYIARKKQTTDIGRVILPVYTRPLGEALSWLVAGLLFVPLVTMSAAGGSLFEHEFGIHRACGGALIVIMVIATLFGDFERMQKVFRLTMPFLFLCVVGLSVYVAVTFPQEAAPQEAAQPSPLAKNWPEAALLYVSYGTMGTIPILSKCALKAKSIRHAMGGAALGAILLASLGLLLVLALMKDPGFSDRLDLPLLGYAGRIGKGAEAAFALVLFMAIYSSATSGFYGCVSRLKDGRHKKGKIVVLAFLAFLLALAGFKKVVAIVVPLKGYIDLVILVLLIANFIRTLRERPADTDRRRN